jgi:uncharacterized protein (TIGR01777 family)
VRVLVTGSSGLIGTALVDSLTGGGHTVTRLVRNAPAGDRAGSSGSSGPSGATRIAWDPDRGTIDAAALDRAGPFDGVVHLAGAGVGDARWGPARKQVILKSRRDGTTLLATALAGLEARPAVLVSASAVGVYGDRGDEVLTEESAAGSGFLADVCVAWERATAPAADAGIRTVVLRTGIVLSDHGGALGKQLPLFRLGLGGRIGTGRQYRSWITLDDHIAVIEHCLTDGSLDGPVNATAPHPATDAELAKAIGTALHRPSFLAVPAPALKLVLGSEMAVDMVLSSQRVLPARLTTSGFSHRHVDIDEAVRSVVGGR